MTERPDWEELTRRGVYDPAAANAGERRDLIEFYGERGISVEAMADAATHGRLITLLGDLGIRPSRDQLTTPELAERAGIDVVTVEMALRAAGLPAVSRDLPTFGDEDVALMKGFAMASELFGSAELLHFVRTIGMAASRVAAGAIHLSTANFSGPLEAAGASEVALSAANEVATLALNSVAQALETIFRHHVEHELRRSILSSTEPGSRTATLAVAFVDLVGFTSVSSTLDADELAGAVTGFESLAGDVITAHGARLVKVIGDEVMYVTHEPEAAARIALEISAAVDAHPALTAARAGITHGPVLTLDGDYYGNEVNLAARAVAAAAPGQVLVTAALSEALAADGFTVTSVGPRELNGFARPVELFALTDGSGADSSRRA